MDSNNLMQALYAMDRERIKAELNAGADVNAPYNKHGWTPGHAGNFMNRKQLKHFWQPAATSTPAINMRKLLLSLPPSIEARPRH